MRSFFCWLATIAATLFVLTTAANASADNKALAETLFIEGKQLMKDGNYEEACKRFQASHQAEQSVGALLNLARCHQKLGKLATAWGEFKNAAGLAERMNQLDRRQGALLYAKELEPLLSRLTVIVKSPVDGLEVRRDDDVLPAGSYGVAVPVDPGTYEITAKAPGFEPWSTQVTVGPNADKQTVTVPGLVPGDDGEPEVIDNGEGSGMHPRAIAGLAVASVGVVSLAVGIAFGAIAIGDKNELDDKCPNKLCPDESGLTDRDSIETKAHVSTATIAIGAAAIIGGGILFLTAPSSSEPEEGARFFPLVGPGLYGIGVTGLF